MNVAKRWTSALSSAGKKASGNVPQKYTAGRRGLTRSGSGKRSSTFRQGVASTLRLMLAPLGRHAAGFHRRMHGEQRLQSGLVILLPGIDGCTTVCDNVARGLHSAGCESAVEIHDWRSFRGWNPLHLTTLKQNRERAREICRRILEYQALYPGRPVHLIGHSAGAGVALLVLEQLPLGVRLTSVVLLAAAISRHFDVHALVDTTTDGVWNFWSRGDLPTVGLGTMIFGTVDRRHSVSAGALGFKSQAVRSDAASVSTTQLHEMNYQFGMVKSWNFGGHFGCTNSVFITRYVAPIIERSRLCSASITTDALPCLTEVGRL